jgi:hypothetical protein
MDTPHDIPLRIARNRLLDLLGIGDSYPLTDLDVIADQIQVNHGDSASIPIEHAQAGVTYRLCDPGGKPIGETKGPDDAVFGEPRAEGNDVRAEITTPPVGADITYRILATKNSWGPALGQLYLEKGARVKVGLNTALAIRILPEKTPLLDPAIDKPRSSDPRIVPCGASVTVEIADTQEGVKYSLVANDEAVLDDKGVEVSDIGTLHAVTLQTGPLREDSIIQVRATKEFLTVPKRAPVTSTLAAKLYVKVMANPALKVAVDPSPIIDYGQGAKIKIVNTQASAQYRAYVRPIPDADFVHGPAAGAEIVSVAVPGKPDAQIRKPAQAGRWSLPEGYEPEGGAPVPGNGGDLTLPIKALKDDSLVIVQVLKEHRVEADDPRSPTLPSAIGLDQAAVVLVRPDPARALELRVPMGEKQTGAVMQVSGGQPGVYYYFQAAAADKELRPGAYFHKRDKDDAQNKGVGELAIEVDLAIAADPDASAADPAAARPRLPLLAIEPLPAGTRLSVRAEKAQSAVEQKMVRGALIPAVPAIKAEQPVIDYGASAKIVIPASDPKDQYQVVLKGVPVKPPVAGDKSDLAVLTDPLQAGAVFEVVVTRAADEGIRVERVVTVPVTVRPKAEA